MPVDPSVRTIGAQAPVRGDVAQPTLTTNPYASTEHAAEFENGYEFAQALEPGDARERLQALTGPSQAWVDGFAKACQDSGIIAAKTARITTMHFWATEAFIKRALDETDYKVQEIYSDFLHRAPGSPEHTAIQAAIYPLRNNPSRVPSTDELEALHARVRGLPQLAAEDPASGITGARAKMLQHAPVEESPQGLLRRNLALADPAAPGHAELSAQVEHFAANPADAVEWNRLHAATSALPPKARPAGPTPMLAAAQQAGQHAASNAGSMIQRGVSRFGKPAAITGAALGAVGLGTLAYNAFKDKQNARPSDQG
jgi:hypothetical protein